MSTGPHTPKLVLTATVRSRLDSYNFSNYLSAVSVLLEILSDPEEATVNSQLLVTLNGIKDDEVGLALRELESMDKVLNRVASILTMLVSQADGGPLEHRPLEGWKPNSRLLELRRSAPGKLYARWTLGLPLDARTGKAIDESKVVDLLLSTRSWEHPASDLAVQDYLNRILEVLPEGVWLSLGDSEDPNRIAIGHAHDATKGIADRDEALISDIHAIGLRSAALFGQGLSAVDHGDLLYDERGLPK